MIAKYEGYNKTQAAIVTNKYGSPDNGAGYQDDIVASLKWINSSKFRNAKYLNLTSSTYNSLVVNNIMNNKAVQTACVPTSNPNLLGHSFVIYSVEDTNKVLMRDSWRGRTSPVSVTKSELVNGFYSHALGKNVRGVSVVTY